MNKFWTLILGMAAVGFAIVGLSGIDLITSRIGLGMVVLGAAGALWSLAMLVRPRSLAFSWLVVLSLLGGAYFLWRAFTGGPPALAMADGVLVLTGLGIYLTAASTDGRKQRIWIFLLGIMVALNVGIALYQSVSPEVFYFWQKGIDGYQIVGGLFGHYNVFASFLNGTIFFFLSYLFLGRQTWLRVVFAVLSVLIFTALVLSGSRGGWVSFVLGGSVWMVLLLVFLKQRGSKMVGVASLLAVILAVVGGVTAVSVVKKLTFERQKESRPDHEIEDVNLGESDGGRFVFQQMAFEVFQDAPVTGQGPRAFSYRALEKWDPASYSPWNARPFFAHNEYLQVLSDYGLIGFTLVIAIFFIHGIVGMAGLLRQDSRDPELPIWQLGALGGLVAILCQSFFSFLFHFPASLALVAFQLGVLVARPQLKEGAKIGGRLAGVLGLGVALTLVALGWPLAQSYWLKGQGEEQLSSARSSDEVLRGFDTLTEAALKGQDPQLLEVVARRAMEEANEALREGRKEEARAYHLRAREALSQARDLNPHFGAVIAGMPRVADALGNYEEADQGHKRAMKELWPREFEYRAHFQAARSSFLWSFRTDDDAEALALLDEARERLQRRLEIVRRSYFISPVKEFSEEVDAWIAFYEGRRLFMKGDDIWKNARPRNPERAMAFLLEAQKRYLKSGKVVRGKDPRWERDFEQLEIHLNVLKAGQLTPVLLSDEEIAKAIRPEAGLASDRGNR